MNPVYVHSSACISPQQTWEAEFIETPISSTGNRLACTEPEYPKWIDPKQLRRMSRVMRMGAAAAMLALKKANVTNPDAIITGTGLGCLDDTANFLGKITEFKEEALNPTPFIQSTHNTIGSHVAFLLQCQNYNQTYSQGAFSFESALIDSMLQISDNPNLKILAGAADEIIDASHTIESRFDVFKKESINSLELFQSKTKGTIHGEGSAWFVLSGLPSDSTIKLRAVKTFYQPKDVSKEIRSFIGDNKVTAIDLVLTGKSGDEMSDKNIDKNLQASFPSVPIGTFKHLCGEFHTASAFAFWLAHSILQTGNVPKFVCDKSIEPVKNILIYNTYFQEHHSLILLSRE